MGAKPPVRFADLKRAASRSLALACLATLVPLQCNAQDKLAKQPGMAGSRAEINPMPGRHRLGGYKKSVGSGSPEELWITVAAEPVTIGHRSMAARQRAIAAQSIAPAAAPASIADGSSSSRPHRDRECQVQARWAADVFDLIEENPHVILSGTDAQDAYAFTFIRKWVRDGKSRDDLMHFVIGQCMGDAT